MSVNHPPACVADAIAHYWRLHYSPDHQPDESDTEMAQAVWNALLSQGRIRKEKRYRIDDFIGGGHQVYVLVTDICRVIPITEEAP